MEHVKEQIITDNYAIYNADCMEVITQLPNESVDYRYICRRLQHCIIIRVMTRF